MRLRAALVLGFSLLASPSFAQTEPAPEPVAAAAEVPVETVLITGTRPGPGLWKLSKNDHVLWILGTYSPLPKNFVWRSKEVESVIAQSQLFLEAPRVEPDIGFFRLVTLVPSAIGAMNNPDNARLQDVLAPETYSRWQVLKQKYMGKNDDVEKQRPVFAAGALFAAALDKSGLENSRNVNATISKLVDKAGLKRVKTLVKFEIKDPRGLLKKFKTAKIEDTACLTTTLERLETDLEGMRTRANAWAMGDIELLQTMTFPDQTKACQALALAGDLAADEHDMLDVERRARALWMSAAEKAIAGSPSTFAVLPMTRIVGPKGFVAELQARGYELTPPR